MTRHGSSCRHDGHAQQDESELFHLFLKTDYNYINIFFSKLRLHEVYLKVKFIHELIGILIILKKKEIVYFNYNENHEKRINLRIS